MVAYAADTAEGTEVVVFEEEFTGARENVKPVGSDWKITRNGEKVEVLDGYDSGGNYGKASPSLGFGRLNGSTEETLETPEFSLPADGKLSFWYKGIPGQGPITSIFKLEIKVNGIWQEIQVPDSTATVANIYEVAIPQATTAIKFTFTKDSGNLGIDDIKLTYVEVQSDVISIDKARALEAGTEATVRGVVSFNDRNKTVHIEDATGGIAIYDSSSLLTNMVKGQLVEVKGTLTTFNGLVEIVPTEAIEIISENNTLPTPVVTVAQLNAGNHDSQYVKVENVIIDVANKTLTQGNDVLNIYFMPENINVQTGNKVNVEGTMGSNNGKVQIYGSSCTFIKVDDEIVPPVEDEVVTVLEEGFKIGSNNKKALPVAEGWVMTQKGEEVTEIGGYDSTGNFAKGKPSIGFGRDVKRGDAETLQSPEFLLKGTGTLSFWYKAQSTSADDLSEFKVEAKVNGTWTSLETPDITKQGDYEATLDSATTAIRLTYTKALGNLSVDDIKVTYKNDVEGLVTIEEARLLPGGTKDVVVRGVVSFNDRNQTLHIQDSTGGISISNYNTTIDFSKIKKGDRIEAKGTIGKFRGLIQITSSEDIKVLSENNATTPVELTIKEILEGNHDSQYVKITNTVIDVEAKTLTQGEDVLDIYYIPSDITVKTGDIVNVAGTMGRFNSVIQIYGSSCTFTKVEGADTEAPIIVHTPVEVTPIDGDLRVSAEVTDNSEVENVTLSYRPVGAQDFKEIKMDKSGENYSAVISKGELNLLGVEYFIKASDGLNISRTPAEGVYTVKITDEDILGPEIYNLTPAEGTSVGAEGRPTISALLKDKTGVAVDSIKLYLDGKDVTSKAVITAESVSYVPAEDLEDGSYKVKVEAKDVNGYASVKEWSFRKGSLSHYFGQLHAHTNISDGTGSLDDAYTHVKKAGADYYAVTDHSNWFDNDTSGSLADGSASTKWTKAQATSNKYNDEGNFTAMYGYEMTWSGSTGGWGHMNTFNTPGFETRTNKAMGLSEYYSALQTQPQSISQLNHPGTTFGDFNDFGFYSAATDRVVTLIEVGNGEGPVRGTGYFPSYEYYTRALDKGWHLAPTNNQDNHKGNWYTSNTARTVIISEDNTREALYNSMQNMSVYSSEDSNMTIDYTINGQMMGTSLREDVNKLNFKVNVADDDAISKVSVIANGGVEVISKTFNSNNVDWEFELNPEYTYYYIKVVQKDKDVAITAPIWVGSTSSFGIEKVTLNNDVVLPNDKVEISTSVYNNEKKDIANVRVELFVDELAETNKIYEEVIANLVSTKPQTVKFNWTPTKIGSYTIYSKVTMNVDGSDKIFTNSVKVNVVNPETTYKVVLDGAHVNQYITGNYAGSYTELKKLLGERNIILSLNTEKITEETLKDADLFILTDPQSVDKSDFNLVKSKLNNSEVDAVSAYVKAGGNIVVTTIADYKDGTGEYSNDKQLNPLLEKIGTALRINDDQVVDNTTNGGQPYRLYLSRYSSPLYNLVDGIEVDSTTNELKTYSFYSGASVVLASGATGENVDFLVSGHSTTTTSDADNAGDNVPVQMGKVNVIGAEELDNGSKVVVAGNTFFSDFETNGTNADTYSNKTIVENIVEWMMPKREVEKVDIADLIIDEDGNRIPDLKGKEVTIEGTVTSQSEAVQPKNSFFEVIYVEDETGGICVFGVSETELKVGQKVRITGVVDDYQGEFEIAITDEDSQVEILDESINSINPTMLSTGDSMLPVQGGKLVKVEGKVVNMDTSNLYIDDGTGVSRVYVEGYIWDGINEDMKGKWDQEIEVGDTVSAIGLASYDPEGPRLRVRDTSEIVLEEKAVETPVSNEEPVINGIEDVTIKVEDKFEPMTGITATDKEDGDLTSKIKIEGVVDTNKAGEYTLTYSVTDSDSNTTTATRKVVVKGEDKPDETNEKPVINGAKNITIKVGDKFDPMAGITATDKEDGDLTSKIKVEGSVNTKKSGKYTLTYTVTDSDNNTLTVTRVITVKTNSSIPQTGGDNSRAIMLVIAVLVIGAGAVLVIKNKKDKKQK